MATFELQGPNGQIFEVEALDEASALSAFKSFSTDGGQHAQPGTYDNTHIAQGMSGAYEGLANTVGAPVDAANWAVGKGLDAINSVADTDFQAAERPFLGSEQIKGWMQNAGTIAPESRDGSKQFARRVGQELGATAVPGAGAVAKAQNPLKTVSGLVASAVGSGVGGAAAQQIAPGNATAEVIGQLAGGATPLGAAKFVQPRLAADLGSPETRAAAKLHRAAKDAGVTPESATGKLSALGSEAMLADVLGEPGRSLARSTANVSPAAREILENASTDRMAGQPDRLIDSLLAAGGLDQPRTLEELQKAARKSAQPAIGKAYEEARSLGYDISPDIIKDLLQSHIVKGAHDDGVKIARARMISEAAKRGIVDGDILKNGPSNLAILDETKQSLDALAAPDLGKAKTNTQSIAGTMAKTLRDRIDTFMPEYGGARDLAQQLYRQQDAIALGARGAKPYVPANFARQAEALNPTHKADLAKGYSAGIIDRIANRRTTPGVVDALFGSKRQKDAMNASLGANASNVQKQLDAERTFAQTHRALTGNSTTARQLADMAVGGGLGLAFGGNPISMGAGALGALAFRKVGEGAVRKMSAKRQASTAPIIAELLKGRHLPREVLTQPTPLLTPDRRNSALALLLAQSVTNGK